MWYYSIKPNSTLDFYDICTKLISCFNMSIPVKRSIIELFSITQQVDESNIIYLQRFNDEMLNMKSLLEPVVTRHD